MKTNYKISLTILFITVITTLSLHAQRRFSGLRIKDEIEAAKKVHQAVSRPSFGIVGNLPTSYLISYIPPVQNQGNFGNCVGWATGYYAYSIAYSNATGIRNTFSPYYLYNCIKEDEDNNCSNGSYIKEALDHIQTKGIKENSQYSQNCLKPQIENTQFKIKTTIKYFFLM